jgi:Leucine-rich repeat (LRR) protein
VVLTGSFVGWSYPQVSARLAARGIAVVPSPQMGAQAIIVGAEPGSQAARGKALGLPLLGAEHLQRLMEGEAWESVLGSLLSPQAPYASFNEVLTDLREWLHGAPSREAWERLTLALDRCAPETLALAMDYAAPLWDRWPDHEEPSPGDGNPTDRAAELGPGLAEDERLLGEMPRRWWAALARGEVSPKFGLARALTLAHEALPQAHALFRGASFPRLRRLTLSGKSAPKELWSSLASSQNLPALQSLRLEHLSLAENDARALGTSHALPQLRHLSLRDCAFDAPTLRALLHGPLARRLETLDLSRCALSAESARHLSELSVRLERLWLPGNQLDDDALEVMTRALHHARPTHLHLGNNPLRARGLRALCESPCASALVWLDLSRCSLSDKSLHDLPVAPHLASLQHLDLGHNLLRDAHEVAAFIQPMRALTSLRLAHNPLRPDELGALWREPGRSRLAHLDLSHTATHDEALATLARAPHLRGLQRLDLRHTHITPAGLRALRESKHLAGLRFLGLGPALAASEEAEALRRAGVLAPDAVVV